jgi:protocatechuate 3,4-dioxygenase alpha subunit
MSAHAKQITTASQTVGPFFEIGLAWLYRDDLAGPLSADAITLRGRVLDGDGRPVPDAVLEIWQADAAGRYPEDARGAPHEFAGFARIATDGDGAFRLRTLQPGSADGQAPHLNVTVLMRGLLRSLSTRVYFPDAPQNLHDPVLSHGPGERRATLIARREGAQAFVWDVHLQGADETVFFEF